MKIHVENINEMQAWVEKMAKLLSYGDVVTLDGDLGAGKTTMVQMFGRVLGIKDEITSPSFSLIHWYPNDPFDVYHVDLYRLEDPETLETIDLDSFLYPDGISFIEWSERGQDFLPRNRIGVLIHKGEGQKRTIEIVESTRRAKEWVRGLENENFDN